MIVWPHTKDEKRLQERLRIVETAGFWDGLLVAENAERWKILDSVCRLGAPFSSTHTDTALRWQPTTQSSGHPNR